MQNLIKILVLVLIVTSASGQTVMPTNLRAMSSLDGVSQGGRSFFYGIPSAPPRLVGDSYLDNEWKISVVQLYENSGMIEGFPMRYDILTNELEFKSDNEIKVLDGKKVKSFVWMNEVTKELSYFINMNEFKNDESVSTMGFFEVLSDGFLPLLKRTEVLIQKADFHEITNMGSKDDKILKKSKLYYIKEGRVFRMPTKHNIMPLFKDKISDVEKYMNVNSLNPKKEEDLIIIVNYYNSISNK